MNLHPHPLLSGRAPCAAFSCAQPGLAPGCPSAGTGRAVFPAAIRPHSRLCAMRDAFTVSFTASAASHHPSVPVVSLCFPGCQHGPVSTAVRLAELLNALCGFAVPGGSNPRACLRTPPVFPGCLSTINNEQCTHHCVCQWQGHLITIMAQ